MEISFQWERDHLFSSQMEQQNPRSTPLSTNHFSQNQTSVKQQQNLLLKFIHLNMVTCIFVIEMELKDYLFLLNVMLSLEGLFLFSFVCLVDLLIDFSLSLSVNLLRVFESNRVQFNPFMQRLLFTTSTTKL